MSSPKSTAKSVKRRGLAIATAVAVAGSGIVGVNYVSAQETENDQALTFGNPEAVERDTVAFTDDVDITDVNGVEVNKVDAPSNSDSAVNSGPGGVKKSPSAQEYFNQQKSAIEAELRPEDISNAPGAEAVVKNFVEQARAEGIEATDAWITSFKELVVSRERAILPEYYAPSAQDFFDLYEGEIAAALRPNDVSKAPGAAAVVKSFVEKAHQAQINTDDAWISLFTKLVESKERAVLPEYYGPTARDYFESRKQAIAADFRSPEGQNAQKFLEEAFAEAENAGVLPDSEDEKALWKEEFRTLVQHEEDSAVAFLRAEAYAQLSAIAEKNPVQAEIFKKDIDETVDPNDLAKLLAAVKAEKKNPVAPFGREDAPKPEAPAVEDEAGVDEAPESPLVGQVLEATKKQAWSYVHESEYLSPGQKAKFQNDIQAAGDLKSVEDAYAEVIQAESEIRVADSKTAAVAAIEGSQFLTDAQKAAYVGAVEAASSVRQVEGLVDAALDAADLQQESAETGAHRAVLNNELGVNSNPVVDPNKQQLIAEDLSYPFAQHRDEVLAQDLVEAKRDAVAAIEGADHLTEEQKSQFKNRINDSTSITAVTAVIDEAHKLADKQAAEESDKAALAEEKSQAHRIIDGLSKLSPSQKAEFKEQVDGANTGAYVAHIVERAQEMNALQNPSGDGAGAQEPGKPGNNETPGNPGGDNKPGQDQKPGNTTDAFTGFFGLAAGLGVFALIFGGILHTINNFDGFGVVQEHVRNAFAKIGIRF